MREEEKPITDAATDGTAAGAASLSRKQQAVLDAVVFLIRRGEIPTVREVGSIVGLRSPSTVFKHLRALEQSGLITLSGKSRGIRLADEGLLQSALEGERDRIGGGSDAVEPRAVGSASSRRPGETAEARRRELLQTHFVQSGRLRTLRASAPVGRIRLAGRIAAGQPFESYSDSYAGNFGMGQDGYGLGGEFSSGELGTAEQDGGVPSSQELLIDPSMFVSSGETFALQIQGDSMIQAGILDGDYVIIRRQETVEEGEIAAVLVDGEGTLKRWCSNSENGQTTQVSLRPENDHFEPIDISSDEGRNVLVLGKYVGLVRGELQFF